MVEIVLVNSNDEPIGTMEKMEAHQSPHLHRAFSVFLFNTKGEMLLQQRASTKYHSAGLWTNACCSHPYPEEPVIDAAQRRMQEELGIETTIVKAFSFTYQANFDNGLFEHEYDHVFIGQYEGYLDLNPDEVAATCYKSMDQIAYELEITPHLYTPWFKIALPFLKDYLSNHSLSASYLQGAATLANEPLHFSA